MAISLDPTSAGARISERDFGLRTEVHRRIGQLIHDYDPNLTLRMIPERDPAFRPPKTMGVYEEGLRGNVSPWVFTIAPEHVDERTFARVVAGDMSKLSGAEKFQLLKDVHLAAQARTEKELAEKQAQRRDEMLFIASTKKTTIRHKINGEDLILGDGIRSPRTHL